MNTLQALGLCAVPVLLWLYWRERSKHRKTTAVMSRALKDVTDRLGHDDRTGLLTLDKFEARLDEEVQRADQMANSLSILAVAIDNFGLISNGFGESSAADVIKLAAERLLTCSDEDASVCKVAAAEYALVVSGGAHAGTMLAQRIKSEFTRPFQIGSDKVNLTCSIGIAVYPVHGARTNIISYAILAMRSLQNSGGADYCLYDPQIGILAREEALLVNDLRQALQRGHFELYFQPKVDAQSLQVTAAEALIRWHHPARGFVSPEVFIPLAEKYGLIGPIGTWVIEEACRQAHGWADSGLRMRVAVNISGYQMRQDNLVEFIQSVLSTHGLQPERFTCEITETIAIEDTQATQLTFEKMRRAGFHVSIDDFGTGYSSLASLQRLPAAELKIDQAFVKDLEQSEKSRSIVRSIVQLAKACNLRIVAEGVETAGQRDLLVAMGCDDLQGYLFSMPMSGEDLQRLSMNRFSKDSADFRDSLYANSFINDMR
jgi:diguanylate cyclase (GGDEF)-like protein